MLIESSIDINRPPQEVFDYVGNLDNAPTWQAGVLEAKWTSNGPTGVGSTGQFKFKVLGRTFDVTVEITEWNPPSAISANATGGPFPASPHYMFAPQGSGTHFTLRTEAEPGGFFRLAGPTLEPTMHRQAESDLHALKTLLESGQ